MYGIRKVIMAFGQSVSHVGSAIQIVSVVLAAVLLLSTAQTGHSCGGCFKLPYQSLLEKVERADRVVVAHPTEPRGSSWKIDRVIKGRKPGSDETIQVDPLTLKPSSSFNGPQILKWGQVFNTWTVEAPANRELVEFLSQGISLSAIGRELTSVRHQARQLRSFLPYLEHPDVQIADSTHAKLSSAPYVVLQELAADLDSHQLLTWIDRQSAVNNKRVSLSVVLLGICGDQRDADLVRQWIDECSAGGEPAYLAALLTAHVELNGEPAVQFLEESYIRNRDRTLGEVIATVDALRTHGEAQTTVSRERIKASFHLLLRERAALSETIIEDFKRWEDWSIAPELMQIHAGGQQPWNNALIIKYLEACPLPAAKQFVKRASVLDSRIPRESVPSTFDG
jgi:hypothetical protein